MKCFAKTLTALLLLAGLAALLCALLPAAEEPGDDYIVLDPSNDP